MVSANLSKGEASSWPVQQGWGEEAGSGNHVAPKLLEVLFYPAWPLLCHYVEFWNFAGGSTVLDALQQDNSVWLGSHLPLVPR